MDYNSESLSSTKSWTDSSGQNLPIGGAESLVPVFVTFAFLAVARLFVTVGFGWHAPAGLEWCLRFP
jgi:hypothetical protein